MSDISGHNDSELEKIEGAVMHTETEVGETAMAIMPASAPIVAMVEAGTATVAKVADAIAALPAGTPVVTEVAAALAVTTATEIDGLKATIALLEEGLADVQPMITKAHAFLKEHFPNWF